MIIGISIRPFMYPNTMFLTEKEAREHLKRNYYHYSEDAHTYCMVAWRSPEVEKLWKILRETKWDCKDKEIESHEEKYILHYCISLMQELVGCFEEWYRWVPVSYTHLDVYKRQKQAQPDFKGILMDSTMILFDAKHTDKDKISRDVVTAEQQACFERYMKLGAMCFLVVSLEFKEFYRVPWVVFRDMKKIYGHKYMNREELEPYRIKYSNGVVKYLDGIVLRERNEDESTEV